MTTDKLSSRNLTGDPVQWLSGATFERPALLFSDGGLLIEPESYTEEQFRARLSDENSNVTDPAEMARLGRVRVEIVDIEHPVLATPTVRDLLQRVRALPRLMAAMKREIDAVLAGTSL